MQAYAIIEDSGTQIMVREGDVLDIDYRAAEVGSTITFDKVLAHRSGDADMAAIGTPWLEDASVSAEVIGDTLGDKIDVIKFKRRKNYRRKMGHRQSHVRVKITSLG
ncbi:MAG: 50S ribosomal protein L21 [Phycisphaerales bacterium]|nr:50S ribosomal protein L21 [Phycisphaerales bacterium]